MSRRKSEKRGVRTLLSTSFLRVVVRLCACLLIVGLVGQTLIVGPIPQANANAAQLPAPVSAPPAPFEVANAGSALSLLPEMNSVIATLVGFAAPKSKDNNATGFENAVLEPLYKESENGKWKTDNGKTVDSEDSPVSPDSSDSFDPNSEFPNPQSPAPPPAGDVEFDFDGDNKADIGRWRGVATHFRVKNSGGGADSEYTLGSSNAVAAPGDFNGDGKTDAAVFSAGVWTYKTSPTATAQTISFGSAGDIPYVGDYDGDGTSDAAIYRPSTNTWWIRQSSNSATVSYQWGATGDIPITGNWDGDTKTDIAVYRNGTWYIQASTAGGIYLNWGLSYDIPVQGDFDDDGKSDVTVFRPTTGTWYILKSSSGFTAYSAANWGVWSDQPTPADYDDDGITDLAIWRPTDGNWYILRSSDNNHEIHALGISGDTAVPSAYTKQVGGTASGDVINAERVKARNATGGTNLYSQNFGWGTSLVGLPGRVGLDAGFGIGYNSLLWLKVGNAMYFDPDKSNVTPGFRMGFPVIEPAYYNATRQKWAYMMATPSGSRVEFLETGASNKYETPDSSYTHLVTKGADNPFDPVEDINITVTTTDGTQMTYAWSVGSYKCTQIKDRNGNYITLAYDSLARLATMTDTLGRVVTVSYGSNGLPSTITQTWKDNNGAGSNTTHTYATFAYTTKAVDTDFGSSITAIIGPPDGTVFNVLDKITYADSSSTRFEYNDYLQVQKVRNFAADNHELDYVRTNLETPSASQSDCPRFTSTSTWAERFNQDTNGVAQPVVIPNSFQTNQQYTLPTGGTATGNLVQITTPDGTVEKTFTGNTGWREGLPIATETWANINSALTKKRWTWTDYTQDDVNLSYIKNPRVIESKIGDTENSFTRRTTVDYWTSYGLTKEVKVYDTDQTTVLKKSYTEYNLDPAYTSRRIIGLPLMTEAWGKNDQTNTLEYVSKVTYAHDDENFAIEPNQDISNVIQHDNTNYSSSFIIGRGNLTATTRHDVTGQTPSVTFRTRFDIAGSVVARVSPWDGAQTRKTTIDYADVFNDAPTNRNTYAYPTKLYDPAGNFSQVKYRYDIGANVWATSPAPAGNSTGKATTREFDSIGRLQKDLLVNTGAYTRYEYPTNGIQSKVFSTIVDTNNNNTGDAADEVLSESWHDGSGRVLRSRSPHTFDATGNPINWAGSIVEYDILGRAKRQSTPTEISVPNPNDPNSWTPAGDDASRGWLWTHQKYDWQGRVIRQINTDGVDSPTLNDSDILISYDGCGCAGGLVTTVQGELVPRDDEPTQSARRIEKTYADILGRVHKTESLKWDGVSVYTSSTSLFNGLDQPTKIRQFKGTAVLNNEHQTSTMAYDGHGRLKTSHQPEQRDSNNDPTYTTYNYNADDSIASATDGRGAVTNNTYNSRGLLEQVSYAVPSGSTIPMISPTSFVYDPVGNRTQMTDQTGTTAYAYDSLSRITSETKQFNGQNSSPTNAFTISYQYHLRGELKSITNPFNQRVDYATDKLGRLTQVTGIPFRNTIDRPQPPYILGNIQYYAFGPAKSISYGSGATMSQSFNNRTQVSQYKVTAVPFWAQGDPHWGNLTAINVQYSYNSDGRIRYSKQVGLGTPPPDLVGDQGYKYDQVGRITNATTGAEARGGIEPNDNYRPYRQNFVYDVWGNVTTRDSRHYSYQENTQHLYSDNRESTWSYDNDGRLTRSNRLFLNYNERIDYVFDAGGSLVTSVSDTAPQCEDTGTTRTTWFWIDGDGQTAARRITAVLRTTGQTSEEDKRFRIHSSVLDQVISEVYTDGSEWITYTYAFGEVIARHQNGYASGWDHRDPSSANFSTTATGQYGGTESGGAMLDPSGSPVGSVSPTQCESNLFDDWWSYRFGPSRRSGSCSWDGAEVSCGLLRRLLMGDSVAEAPFNQSELVTFNGKVVRAHFRATADGFAGYVPINGKIGKRGRIEPIGQQNVSNYQLNLERQALGRLNGINDPIISGELSRVLRDTSAFRAFSSDRWLSEEDCDAKFSEIFGGVTLGMDNLGDINPTGGPRIPNRSPHSARARNDLPAIYAGERLPDRGGILHTYANAGGTADPSVPLTVPGGWSGTGNYYSGGNSGLIFHYSNGITIEAVHVGTANTNNIPTVPRNPGAGNLARIGFPGGPGGISRNYNHAHWVFFANKRTNERIDPRELFCGW